MDRSPPSSRADTPRSPSSLRLPALLLVAVAVPWVAACAGLRGPGPADVPEPDAAPETRPEPETPARWYWAYVANRESDVVSRIRFGPEGAAYEKSVDVGVMPNATDAPLGVAVAPDGRHWYVTTSPGTRVGRLFKYRTGSDRQVASVTLGSTPGAVDLTPDGAEAWVADPGTDDEPGSAALAVVRTDSLREVARLGACDAPRGSRVARSGDRVYVACPDEDLLMEIDADGRRVRRALRLGPAGAEVVPGDRLAAGGGSFPGRGGEPTCEPAALETGDGRLWIACARAGEVVEVDAGSLRVRRRLAVGEGPTALALTPEGSLLVAANRGGGTVSVLHLDAGRELTRIETSRPSPRAVAVSDDSRYAFVTNDAEGARRSTVDVIDLTALVRVAEVELEYGAGGIAFWRSSPTGR